MDLSIIIINWNSADHIRNCLKSLHNNTQGISLETIVVDNASYDGSKEIIENEFPEVIFVQSSENLGFAKGNNLGFKYSKGDALLFLNPDTEILDDAIVKMFGNLQSIPNAGIVGCKLLNSDLSVQTSCIQPFPTLLNQMLDIERLKVAFPSWSLWGIKPLLDNNYIPEEVEVIPGACFMIHRSLFEKAGMFSSKYFMYTEDIDLCYRIREYGYKAYYISNVSIVHHAGKSVLSQSADHFSSVLMRESVWKYFLNTKGQSYANFYKITTTMAAIIRLCIIHLLLVIPVGLMNKESLRFSSSKWKKILRWSLGLEKWVREFD